MLIPYQALIVLAINWPAPGDAIENCFGRLGGCPGCHANTIPVEYCRDCIIRAALDEDNWPKETEE